MKRQHKVNSKKALNFFEDYCVNWALWFAVTASVAKVWVNNAWLLIVNAENGSNRTCADSVTRTASNTLIGVDEGFLHFESFFAYVAVNGSIFFPLITML